MVSRLVILGGGGCAREVLDVVDALNADGASFVVDGVLDDGRPDPTLLSAFDVEVRGPISALSGLSEEVEVVIGVGRPDVRASLARAIGPRRSPVLVHPTA